MLKECSWIVTNGCYEHIWNILLSTLYCLSNVSNLTISNWPSDHFWTQMRWSQSCLVFCRPLLCVCRKRRTAEAPWASHLRLVSLCVSFHVFLHSSSSFPFSVHLSVLANRYWCHPPRRSRCEVRGAALDQSPNMDATIISSSNTGTRLAIYCCLLQTVQWVYVQKARCARIKLANSNLREPFPPSMLSFGWILLQTRKPVKEGGRSNRHASTNCACMCSPSLQHCCEHTLILAV